MRILLTAIFPLLALAACATAVAPPPTSGDADQQVPWSGQQYKLYPGDKVGIQIFGEENLSGDYAIDSNGSVNFPLIGQINAAGGTITDLEKTLRRALSQGYLLNPQVRVEVLSYRPIYVDGEVNKQGEYPFSPGLTVQQVVTLAGGLTRFAADKYYLQRSGSGPEDRFRVTADTFVFPGDLVSVGERLF